MLIFPRLICIHYLGFYRPTPDNEPIVQSYEVCKNLLTVQPFKADNVPSWILKVFAYVLAQSITTVFNESLPTGIVRESGKNPILFQSWKHNNLYNGEGDTRPISLTPCLSKVLENFVVSWLIDDVKDKIDRPASLVVWKAHLQLIASWTCSTPDFPILIPMVNISVFASWIFRKHSTVLVIMY